jgi:hypothetical protein
MFEQKDVQRCRKIAVKKVSTSNELIQRFGGQLHRAKK